jgi:hypothetical protein
MEDVQHGEYIAFRDPMFSACAESSPDCPDLGGRRLLAVENVL